MRLINYFIFCSSLLILGTPNFTQGSPSPHLSSILDKLLANYDKRDHPYHGKQPVTVSVSIFIISLNIDDIDRKFTASMYLRQKWQDERLTYNTTDEQGNKNMCIELHEDDQEKIWLPDTFIVNEMKSFIHLVTAPNKFLRICPSGSIAQSTRITLTASCPMKFTIFPFDTQICEVGIDSYGKDEAQLIYKWAKGKTSVSSVGMSENVSDPIFTISNGVAKELQTNTSTGIYTGIGFEFTLRRNWHGYKQTFFYPMILFSCISLLTIWVIQYQIGTVVNLINFGVLNIFMALVGNRSEQMKRRGVETTAMDSYFCITNGTVLSCFLVSMIGLYLEIGDNKGLNPLGNEMRSSDQVIRNVDNDDTDLEVSEHTNIEGDSRHLIADPTPSNTAMLERIILLCQKPILKICFTFLKLTIILLYIVLNISYWNYYPFQ